jgi:hypothetical protein
VDKQRVEATSVEDRVEAITALLVETMAAHGRFEETELKGVYDKEWARWYAAYAVEHGMARLVGHDLTAERLGAFLASSNIDYEKSDAKGRVPWADYTAPRISAEL